MQWKHVAMIAVILIILHLIWKDKHRIEKEKG